MCVWPFVHRYYLPSRLVNSDYNHNCSSDKGKRVWKSDCWNPPLSPHTKVKCSQSKIPGTYPRCRLQHPPINTHSSSACFSLFLASPIHQQSVCPFPLSSIPLDPAWKLFVHVLGIPEWSLTPENAWAIGGQGNCLCNAEFFWREARISAPSPLQKSNLLSSQPDRNVDCAARCVNWFYSILNRALLYSKSIISAWSCLCSQGE